MMPRPAGAGTIRRLTGAPECSPIPEQEAGLSMVSSKATKHLDYCELRMTVCGRNATVCGWNHFLVRSYFNAGGLNIWSPTPTLYSTLFRNRCADISPFFMRVILNGVWM